MRQINYLNSYLNLSPSLKQSPMVIKKLRGSHPHKFVKTRQPTKHRNGQLTALLNYLRCCCYFNSELLLKMYVVSIRNVRFKKDIIFSSNAVFHMFVTAVCLLFLTRGVICFYEREARARVPAQACYCRSLRHSDVADC